MSSDPQSSLQLSESRRITLPLALLVAIVLAVAVGYARLTSSEERLSRHEVRLVELEADAKATREILIRIEERSKAIDDKLTEMRRSMRKEP